MDYGLFGKPYGKAYGVYAPSVPGVGAYMLAGKSFAKPYAKPFAKPFVAPNVALFAKPFGVSLIVTS